MASGECRGHNSLRPGSACNVGQGRNELWPLHPNYFVKQHYGVRVRLIAYTRIIQPSRAMNCAGRTVGNSRVQQRRQQAMGVSGSHDSWLIDRILNHAHRQPSALTMRGILRIESGKRGAIASRESMRVTSVLASLPTTSAPRCQCAAATNAAL